MGGSDEKCNIYDKPLFADRSQAGIYKFDKERMEQGEGRLGHIGTKSFAGAADHDEPRSTAPRNAPVEFERDSSEPRNRARSRSRRGSGRARGSDDNEDKFGLD